MRPNQISAPAAWVKAAVRPAALPVVLSSTRGPHTLRAPCSRHYDFSNPLLWAVFIGWIISVVLHEFAHGIVAYWGGDYTIRERGGLTLNPLQYVDPVFSLVILPYHAARSAASPCRAA